MPDTKLRPTSTMKNKDKSSELRVGDVNATNRNSYLNIIFIKLVTQYVKKTLLKTKIRTFEVIRFQNTLKCLSFLKPTSTALVFIANIARTIFVAFVWLSPTVCPYINIEISPHSSDEHKVKDVYWPCVSKSNENV